MRAGFFFPFIEPRFRSIFLSDNANVIALWVHALINSARKKYSTHVKANFAPARRRISHPANINSSPRNSGASAGLFGDDYTLHFRYRVNANCITRIFITLIKVYHNDACERLFTLRCYRTRGNFRMAWANVRCSVGIVWDCRAASSISMEEVTRPWARCNQNLYALPAEPWSTVYVTYISDIQPDT